MDLFNQMTWEQVRNLLQAVPLQGQEQSLDQQSQSQIQYQEYALEIIEARQYLLDSPWLALRLI